MSPRPDAPFLREWLRTKPQALPAIQAWQKLPFFEVAPEIWRGFEDAPISEPVVSGPLPFDDFLICLENEARDDGVTLTFFARVFGPPEFLANAQEHLPAEVRALFELYIVVVAQAACPNRVRNLLTDRGCVAFNKQTGKTVFKRVRVHPLAQELNIPGKDDDLETFATIASMVGSTLAYLARIGHAVEERKPLPQDPKARAKAEKTAKNCPWLREDLPIIRLMTPEVAAARYGQRRARAPSGRQSPRGHARRGHLRRLRDAQGDIVKTLHVRPAWIGPEAWQHAGRHYQLLSFQTQP